MQRRKGFTLIELLVVIAIIAVLAAILFPIFTAAKERSRAVKCVANLKQIGNAMKMYGGDWSGKFPWCTDFTFGHPLISDALAKYIGQGKKNGVWVCPSDIGAGVCVGQPVTPYWQTCDTSYGYPGSNYKGWGYPYLAGLSQENPVDVTQLAGAYKWIWQLPLSKRPLSFDHNPFHYLTKKGVNNDRFTCVGMNNMLLCDGHVKPMDYKKFQTYLFSATPPDSP